MSLYINGGNTVDFFINGTPVERGYLNGYLFWERKLDLWLSSFLPPGQGVWYGYFDIDAQIQARAPGFKGDVTFHVDCPVVATNVDYPIDAGPNAPYRGYRSFVIRVEPNGAIYGFGGYGGAGGSVPNRWNSTYHGNNPIYNYPQDGYAQWGVVDRGGAAGAKGGDGGGCINGRGYAVLSIPNAWRNHLLAGGGGGGGSGKMPNHTPGGGGGGIGHNNAPGGPAGSPGGGGNAGSMGLGGRGNEGPNNWGGPNYQPAIGGYGGLSAGWGENAWAPSNGGNGGSWNQGGGGGGMSLVLWTNWDWEGHFKGRDGSVAPDPTNPGWGGGPGSWGSGHDYRHGWADGGFGGRSGVPITGPRAIYYY